MRIRWLVLLTIVSFTLPVLRLGPAKNLADAARWPMLFLVAGLALAQARGRRLAPTGKRVVGALVVIIVCFATSSAFGVNAPLAYSKMLPFIAEAVLAVIALPLVFGPNDWIWLLFRVRWFLGVLTITAGFVGVVDPRLVIQSTNRLSSLSNANSVGVIAMAASLLWLWQWSSASQLKWRWITLCMLSGCVATLWWTGSRASLGGFVVGVAVWIFVKRRSRRTVAAVMLMIGFSLVLRPGLLRQSGSLFQQRIYRGADLFASREDVWNASVASWRARPWIGYGYGISAMALEREGDLINSIGALRDGSGYLGVLESVGVVGVLALFAFFGFIIIPGFHAARASPKMQVGPGLPLIMALLINASAEPWLLGPGSLQQLLMWIAAASILASAQQLWLWHGVSKGAGAGVPAGWGHPLNHAARSGTGEMPADSFIQPYRSYL
jgi:O-antigen ligase